MKKYHEHEDIAKDVSCTKWYGHQKSPVTSNDITSLFEVAYKFFMAAFTYYQGELYLL